MRGSIRLVWVQRGLPWAQDSGIHKHSLRKQASVTKTGDQLLAGLHAEADSSGLRWKPGYRSTPRTTAVTAPVLGGTSEKPTDVDKLGRGAPQFCMHPSATLRGDFVTCVAQAPLPAQRRHSALIFAFFTSSTKLPA